MSGVPITEESMEFAIYVFAALGVLALIGAVAGFVATVWTHESQISKLEKNLKDIEHYYDGRMDRMFDRVNELESRMTGAEEMLTEDIISSLKPKSGSKLK